MMDPPVSDDTLLSGVAELPRLDVEPAVAARIRAAALSELNPVTKVPGLWTRVFEPALVVASALSYLTWTAQTLSSLHAASRVTTIADVRTR